MTPLALAACALLLGACRHWPPGLPRLAGCPGELASSEDIRDGFLRREQVRVQGPGVEEQLEVVTQMSDGTLVVVVWNAFGAQVLRASQTGRALSLDAPLARVFPLPPVELLRDLHAAHFLAGAPGVTRDRSQAGLPRAVVRRPGCEHRSTWLTVEQRSLP